MESMTSCDHRDASGRLTVWNDKSKCQEPCGEWHIRCTRCHATVYGCIMEGTK